MVVKGFKNRGTDCITRCVWELTVALWWFLFCRCFLALCPGDGGADAAFFSSQFPREVTAVGCRIVQRQARLKTNRQTEILGWFETRDMWSTNAHLHTLRQRKDQQERQHPYLDQKRQACVRHKHLRMDFSSWGAWIVTWCPVALHQRDVLLEAVDNIVSGVSRWLYAQQSRTKNPNWCKHITVPESNGLEN